jgi:hypothetical protein
MTSKVEPMFIDEIIKDYSKPSSFSEGRQVNLDDLEKLAWKQHYIDRLRKKQAEQLDDKVKLFLINGAVADDLYHFPHEKTIHADAQHLPFPAIFFEFIDPLAYNIVEGVTMDVKAILFGKARDVSVTANYAYEENLRLIPDNLYSIQVFPDNIRKSVLPTEIMVDFEFMQKAKTTSEFNSFNLAEDISYTVIRETTQDLVDLCVNLVSYINAYNVTIRRNPGKTRKQIERMNRGKTRREKLPLKTVRPYHWIEIKQITTTVGDTQLGHEGPTLTEREWVRGHFQVYHTTDGKRKSWVQSYVRGPPNAPWKENRYKVLDNMKRKGPEY